jgi:peroxisomal 3,2-trans-enoyl-CoA isomerase
VAYIRLNRPKTYNSLNLDCFEKIAKAFNDANASKEVNLAVLTGAGNFFSSGNDQSNIAPFVGVGEKETTDGINHFMGYVDGFIKSVINFKKPLIVAANGPGIGFGCTILGLADYVVCTDDAYFLAPFSQIGLSAEFCSTITFPLLMGRLRASRVLTFGHKVKSNEALEWGLANKVVPKGSIDEHVKEWLHGPKGLLKTSEVNSMLATTELLKTDEFRQQLHQANDKECAMLKSRLKSPEAQAFAKKFLKK